MSMRVTWTLIAGIPGSGRRSTMAELVAVASAGRRTAGRWHRAAGIGRGRDSPASHALVCLGGQVPEPHWTARVRRTAMPYEYTPPKYAQVIAELQRRIESGEYPPGSLLPSEHQLSAEFGIARPTVVRALRELRQAGWIDTQQGKGSFVRGRPALTGVSTERRGQAELDRDESREAGELVSASKAAAPPDRGTARQPGAELVAAGGWSARTTARRPRS